jgi:16S rRNA (guanine527-N7)-methyltransferase
MDQDDVGRWGVDPETAERLERFVRAVETSPHNLVSRRALAELRERHVPECIALARMLPTGAHDLLDVGSGGGFPGLVIAAVRPELRVTLLDSTRKKTEFLAETAEVMGVRVDVVNDRAEEVVRSRGRSFDLVTARAVAPLDRLLGWTVPFLRPGGLLYAVKGERWAEELEEAEPELRRLRAQVVATPDDAPDVPDRPSLAVTPLVVIIAPAP